MGSELQEEKSQKPKAESNHPQLIKWTCLKSFLPLAFCFLQLHCSTQSRDESVKFHQYYNQGELLYQTHCSNCHQKNGTGLGRLYPPINKSDYMQNNFENVICLIRNGKSGELVVNGISFNQPMPGIPALSDLEIAEISTYIYNTWEHQRGIIEVKEVSKILQSCPPN